MVARPNRQLLTTLRRELPLERGERILLWDECRGGCRLAVTRHGLWEWPHRRPPYRHCWRAVEGIEGATTDLSVRSTGQSRPACTHRLPDRELAAAARELDRGSRPVELCFTLHSGSRLRIEARHCGFEQHLIWRTDLTPAPSADGRADETAAAALLQRARADYGTGSGPATTPAW